MARNQVTLTFVGDARNLEKTIDAVAASTHKLGGHLATIGKNAAAGGGFLGIASAALSMAAPLGAATMALAAFGAVAAPELKKGSKGAKDLESSFHSLQKSMAPFVNKVLDLGEKVLRNLLPALKVMAKAGGKVIEAFLKPLDKFVSSSAFSGFINQFAKFAVQLGNLAGPQLTKLLSVLMQLFVQLFPSGMTILRILLPLIVSLVASLTPFIVNVSKLAAATLSWLQRTHLLLPVLALVALAVLAIGGPVWALAIAVGVLIAVGAKLGIHWKTIWTDIKNVVIGVWDWIKGHWPLLLGILTGPIGAAVIFIVTHWGMILDAGKRVWSWIAALPGRVAGVFARLASAIAGPFISGFNAIRNAWNSTIGGKGFSIPSWVPGIGGDSFHIPTFHTGGVVGGSGEQLALVKGGEGVFTPAQMAAMGRGSQRIVLEIRGGHSDFEQFMMKFIRNQVRVKGGGDVQAAFGWQS